VLELGRGPAVASGRPPLIDPCHAPACLGGVPGQSAGAGIGLGHPFGEPERVEQVRQRQLRLALLGEKGVGPRLARRTGDSEPVGLDGFGDGAEAVEQAAGFGHQLGVGTLQGVRPVGPGDESGPAASGRQPRDGAVKP
jgi:hypothetical protein